MRHSLLAILCFALFGCDTAPKDSPSTPTPSPASQKQDVESVSTGPIHVEEFKIQASQNVMRMEDMPKDIESIILKALHERTTFSKDAKRSAKGSAMLDVRTSAESVEVMLVGNVTTQDLEQQRYSAEVVVSDADIDDRRIQPLLDEAVRRFVKRIDAQARVKSAPDAELIGVLTGTDEAAVKLVAVQEARDRRLRDAIEHVRPLLSNTDARLQVAAAAMLVSLKDTQSNAQIIEITEHYSREGSPQMLPMLYIVADMGTDEARTYLAAVAEGHAAAAVRQVASEALNRQP